MDTAVNYTLPDTLVCGMFMWVHNSAAGNITITAPANCAFRDGGTTMVMPAGTNGCFQNLGGAFIHSKVSAV